MTENIQKLISILDEYSKEGNDSNDLRISDILQRAGEPDLLKQMSLSELRFLIDVYNDRLNTIRKDNNG